MATKNDLITKAVEGALEEIKKHASEEFSKLEADPGMKEKILQAAKATATETLKLAEELTGPSQDIAKRIAKHLPDDRVKLLEDGLNIPTFRMDIIKKDDGKYWLEFTRDGKEFLPTDELASRFDVDWGITLQYADILIGAVLLVISAVGISLSPSANVIKKTVNETASAIRSSSKLRRAPGDFIGSWDAAGSDRLKMAKILYDVIKDNYLQGILWTIVKSICSDMEWHEWLETSAKVSTMIIASIATDGAALTAEIAHIVPSAADFTRKIGTIAQLSDVKKSL